MCGELELKCPDCGQKISVHLDWKKAPTKKGIQAARILVLAAHRKFLCETKMSKAS